MGHNIAQLRPYYSVYVPRTPARAIRLRRPAREEVRHCSSLPTEGLMGVHPLSRRAVMRCVSAGVRLWR